MSVHVQRDGSRLTATIDRPDALNAIDFEVMGELEAVLDTLESDGSLRTFVLTGAGDRSFISGGDLRAFADLRSEEDAAQMATRMRSILERVESLACWTIAAVNADAYGGGCETALAFDFRISADGAHFGFTQARFDVTPGWGGLTRLVELVGRPTALKWLARSERVPAIEALEAGLADEVVASADLDDAIGAWHQRLATGNPALIRALKQGASRALGMPRDRALEAELEPFARLWASDGHHEKIADFLQRSDSEEHD